MADREPPQPVVPPLPPWGPEHGVDVSAPPRRARPRPEPEAEIGANPDAPVGAVGPVSTATLLDRAPDDWNAARITGNEPTVPIPEVRLGSIDGVGLARARTVRPRTARPRPPLPRAYGAGRRGATGPPEPDVRTWYQKRRFTIPLAIGLVLAGTSLALPGRVVDLDPEASGSSGADVLPTLELAEAAPPSPLVIEGPTRAQGAAPSIAPGPVDPLTTSTPGPRTPDTPGPALEALAGLCHPSYGGCVPVAVEVACGETEPGSAADPGPWSAAGGDGGPITMTGPIAVLGPDVHGLDHDGDGIACN